MKISSRRIKPVVALVGSALMLTGGFAVADANNGDGFAATELAGGYLLAEKEAGEGKCGEGKCGGEAGGEGKDAAEGKCGEGKCGGDSAAG